MARSARNQKRQFLREVVAAVFLLFFGWAAGNLGSDLFPDYMPNAADKWFLLALLVGAGWVIYFNSSVYDRGNKRLHKQVLFLAILATACFVSRGYNIVANAPSPDELLKAQIWGWVTQLDAKAKEVAKQPVDTFRFELIVPPDKNDGRKVAPTKMRLTVALLKKNRQLMLGSKIVHNKYTEFRDTLPPLERAAMQGELDAMLIELDPVNATVVYIPGKPLNTELQIMVDPDETNHTEFIAAATSVLKAYIKVRWFARDQVTQRGGPLVDSGECDRSVVFANRSAGSCGAAQLKAHD